MTKDGIRKCSHCGHIGGGHKSRACKGSTSCSSIKIFGVKINVFDENHHPPDSMIRRSKSTGSLQGQDLKSPPPPDHAAAAIDLGYLSDDLLHSATAARKKGITWSEEEHRAFLMGLEKLGKGAWRGISKDYVPSRTPTQVASHAQKYFIRINKNNKKNTPHRRKNSPSQTIPSSSTSSHIPMQQQAIQRLEISPLGWGNNPFTVHERPPIPPPLALQSFNRKPYMMQNISAARVMPAAAVSWTPLLTYRNQSYASNFVQYMPPQSAVLLAPPVAPPLAAAPAIKNEGLDLSMGALSL